MGASGKYWVGVANFLFFIFKKSQRIFDLKLHYFTECSWFYLELKLCFKIQSSSPILRNPCQQMVVLVKMGFYVIAGKSIKILESHMGYNSVANWEALNSLEREFLKFRSELQN